MGKKIIGTGVKTSTKTSLCATRRHRDTQAYHKLGPPRRREPRDQRDVVGREFLGSEPSRSSRGRRLQAPDRHQVTRPDVVDAGLRALGEIGREAGLATSQRIDRLESQ